MLTAITNLSGPIATHSAGMKEIALCSLAKDTAMLGYIYSGTSEKQTHGEQAFCLL